MKVVIKTKAREEIFQNVRVMDYGDGIVVMAINADGKVDTQIRRFDSSCFQIFVKESEE